MYNEIWTSVEALLKPPHRLSDIVAIPDLTLDLIGLLRITLNESQFSDASKYKRIIKQEFAHPMYQIINIVFDFDDENAEPKFMKIMYEGKFTLFTLVPFNYVTEKTSLNGPVPEFMLDYMAVTRQLTNAMSESSFTKTSGSDYLENISLHAIPLLFTKWMTNVYGMDKSVADRIVQIFEEVDYPAQLTNEHIGLYLDLLSSTSVEKLLDYGYIATEEQIIKEAYAKKLFEMGAIPNPETEDNHELKEEVKQDAKDIPEA